MMAAAPLVVLLTCDTRNESLMETFKSLIEKFPEFSSENMKHLQFVSFRDICESSASDDSQGSSAAQEAVTRLLTMTKKPKTEHDDMCVYVLYDYPLTTEQLKSLINQSKDFPIIDSVVKLVNIPNGSGKSSYRGPETTASEVHPTITDYSDRAIGKVDIEHFIEAMKVASGGVWADLTYDELNTVTKSSDGQSIPMELSSLAEQLAEFCLHMCHLKSDFKEWSRKRTVTALPTDRDAQKRIKDAVITAERNSDYISSVHWKLPRYSSYGRIIESIPANLRGVGAVLYSIVESVSHDKDTLESLQSEVSLPAGLLGLAEDDGSVGSTGEKPFHMLKQGFVDMIQHLDANVFTVEEGDLLHGRVIRAKELLTTAKEDTSEFSIATSVLSFERDALFRGQVPRLIGQGGMPLHASIPYKDRCTEETELLTFTALSAFDFHRYNQLVVFNRMVERGVPPRIDFTGIRRQEHGGGDESALKRKYFKRIPALTLPQVLAKELVKEPVVSREYYPMTDQLLLCLYWPPPHRRMKKTTWTSVHNLHIRPSFGEYLVLSERQNFTPRTAASVHNCINVSASEMSQFGENTVFITPSDKSIVLLKSSLSTRKAWVTVHSKDIMFGLRQMNLLKNGQQRAAEGMFFLHSDDNVRTTVAVGTSADMCVGKPDENGTVVMTMLFPSELRVSVCSNGSVAIATPLSKYQPDNRNVNKSPKGNTKFDMHQSNSNRSFSLTAPEVNRLVCNGGCVVRFLAKGGPFSRDILCPDGSRILVRDLSEESDDISVGGNKTFTYPVWGILDTILREAPQATTEGEWQYVVLDANGNVFYSFNAYGDDNKAEHVSSRMTPNICKHSIDAETQAIVMEFKDGRVICISTDDLLDVYFPDGTRVTTHQSGSVVFIDHPGHPPIEVDLETDSISRQHSKGFTVPIAKGGDKTRTKIAMPDGTAVMINYDTRVTATYNGSIKAIRRDKSVIYAMDGGVLSFVSADEWNKKSAQDFIFLGRDAGLKPRATPLLVNRNMGRITSTRNSTLMASVFVNERNPSDTNPPTSPVIASKQKKSVRRKPKKLMPLGLTASPKRFQNAPPPQEEEKILEAKSEAARYTFDLNYCQLVIEDHENNVFDIELLEDPMSPMVSLAGEVDGLKPKAVAATNIEPRLFVVSRSADAVEVCRSDEVNDLRKAEERIPVDYKKYSSEVIYPPCNLGGSIQHSYFCQKKIDSFAGFSFRDVFSERPWVCRPRPASLSISLKKLNSRYLATENAQYKKKAYEVFVVKTFAESAPLSEEGYGNLAEDLRQWESFKQRRSRMELSFTVEDHRSENERKDEADLQKKLKAAYKTQKQSHKKEKEKDQAAALKAAAVKDLPMIEEQPESHDDFDAETDNDEELTPEELEIDEAFNAFVNKDLEGLSSESIASDASSHLGVLDMRGLQSALIQVFNRFVNMSEITDAYYDATGVYLEADSPSDSMPHIDYDCFRRIHFSLQNYQANKSNFSSTSVSRHQSLGDLGSTSQMKLGSVSKMDLKINLEELKNVSQSSLRLEKEDSDLLLTSSSNGVMPVGSALKVAKSKNLQIATASSYQ